MCGIAEVMMERTAPRDPVAAPAVIEDRLHDCTDRHPSCTHHQSAAWREIAALPDAVLGAARALAGWQLPPGLRRAARLQVVACASSFPAAAMARATIERAAGIPVDLASASAFRRRAPALPLRTALVLVSRPDEETDTRAIMQIAVARGLPMIGIGDMPGQANGSTAATGWPVLGGPSFTSEAHGLMRLGIALGEADGRGDAAFREELAWGLATVPVVLAAAISREAQLRLIAGRLAAADEVLFIGRGGGAALAQAGALELAQRAGLHAEGLAADGLQRLPAGHLRKGAPVILCAPSDENLPVTLADARALRSRGIHVSMLTDSDGAAAARAVAEETLVLPGAGVAGCFAIAAALQLLAAQAAEALGFDASRPRPFVHTNVAEWAPAA